MKLTYQLFSPNGNLTALVLVKSLKNLTAKERIIITQAIIKQRPNVEQVGFISKDRNQFQFQMAGNEFSGNGLRAAGCYLLREESTNSLLINMPKIGRLTVKKDSNNQVWAQIPLPQNIKVESVNSTTFSLDLLKTTNLIRIVNKPIARNNVLTKAGKIMEQSRGWQQPGAAIVFLRQKQDLLSIQVAYWVRDLASFVYESACGSASGAVAILKSLKLCKSLNLKITQANNTIIDVKTLYKQGKIEKLSITGPIKYLGSDKITVN